MSSQYSEAFPVYYARIQNNLGIALRALAEVRDPEASLERAIGAYMEALKIRTYETLPVDYATTQINLGNALGILAQFRDRDQNLQRAISAMQEALRVFSFESFPLRHAFVRLNLGELLLTAADALKEKGETERSTETLKLAETSLKESVRIFAGEGLTEPLHQAQQELKSVRTALSR